MNTLWLKNLSRALFRDPSEEHPELEARIDHYIVALTRFSMFISLFFWPLIVLMGYLIQLSMVKLAFIVVGGLGFTTSLLFVGIPKLRVQVALFFFLLFPGVIAFYVSTAFDGILDINENYSVIKDGVRYLQFTQDQFIDYFGLFDRLASVNFFYALSLIFLAIAPLKFKRTWFLVIPYTAYGVAAFISAHRPFWLVIYFCVIAVGVAIKGIAEYLVVEAMRKRLADEDEIKRMSRALVERELELARDIQQSLPIPGRITTDYFDIEFFLKPNALVGGDWVAVRKEPDGSFWILVIDAVGKGVQAALVVHAIQSLWTAASQAKLDAESWIAQVNDTLMRMGQKTPHCVTLGLLRLDIDAVTYWSAAHCPLLLLSETDGAQSYHELQARGGMIGMNSDLRLVPKHLDLRAFEKMHLVLCSDGLLSVIPRAKNREELMARLEGQFMETLSAVSADDDLAVVSIRFRRTLKTSDKRDVS